MPHKRKAIYLGWATVPNSRQVEGILSRDFSLVFAGHFRFGDTLDQDHLTHLGADFIFNFGPIIVRQALLESVQGNAVNFHTGPPRWPGRGSCSLALLNGDKEFGVTAHIMEHKIDAGPILRVTRFPIEATDYAESLHNKTLTMIPPLVEGLVTDLREREWNFSPNGEKWEREAFRIKDVLAQMEIGSDNSEETALRKIRAFAYTDKPGPFIVHHGMKFWYLKDRS